MSVTVVIPARDEATRIGAVVREAKRYADEVVVVDDASSDETGRAAEDAGARVLRNPSNLGYIESIKRGFQAAAHDVVVTLDGDGELPADRIPDLVAPIFTGRADMVQGSRKGQIPRPSEIVLNWIANRVAAVGDSGTGMRAMRMELARALEIRGRCICGVLALEAAWRGARISEIPIDLRTVDKPRGTAWHHGPQLFMVLAWVLRFLARPRPTP